MFMKKSLSETGKVLIKHKIFDFGRVNFDYSNKLLIGLQYFFPSSANSRYYYKIIDHRFFLLTFRQNISVDSGPEKAYLI